MVWQKDKTTESKNVCLGKPLERAGKLQTQHIGTATISANYTHRPKGEGGISQGGTLQSAEVHPTSYSAIENQGLGILHSRRLIANEGRGKEQLTSHSPRIHTPPAPRIPCPVFTTLPPNTTQEQIWGGADKGSLPQLGLGSWQVWETEGQEGAFVPYSVFPKPFAFSLPGACSTILPQMQCKQERETESQRCVRGPETPPAHPSSFRFRCCISS